MGERCSYTARAKPDIYDCLVFIAFLQIIYVHVRMPYYGGYNYTE